MMVGIAEEYPLGEVLIHVGGIGFRLFDQLVLFQRPFLRQRRAARQDEECCGEGEQIADYAVQVRSCTQIDFLLVMACTRWSASRLAAASSKAKLVSFVAFAYNTEASCRRGF